MTRTIAFFTTCLSLILATSTTLAEGTGSAVVRVVAEPPVAAGTFRFAGTPAGELRLDQPPGKLTTTQLAAGRYTSTLERIDPAAVAAGYRLTDIRCDNPSSGGDVAIRKATFQIDVNETVTCVFTLTASGDCICPKEGAWRVNNLPGQMVCTGPFPMTVPLTPNRGSGTFKIEDNCQTIVASGLSEDEATMVMRRNNSCGYEGAVGGSQDGIPMTIAFNWSVESETQITGSLHSTVSQQGMTCDMSRRYELDFDG